MGTTMAKTREEAAPTFSSWKARLEGADGEELQKEVSRFLQILSTLGTPMIDGPEVNFVYYGPEASHVWLAGEFNQWGRGGRAIPMKPIGVSGFFCHTLELAEPARLEYKLIVDGEWQTDPLCPNQVDNGVGGSNSYFIVVDVREPPELRNSNSRARLWEIAGAFTFTCRRPTRVTLARGLPPFTCTTVANTSNGPSCQTSSTI